jgi:hypothetical protein
MRKLHKEFCEIEDCNINDSKLLHHHHIIERTDLGTSNDCWNLAVLCPTHHAMVHSGQLKILGVFPSTAKYGRTLVYELNGIPNIKGINKPYFQPKIKGVKIYEKK